ESRIYELKRKNQELEKYRFVLNYKIKELQNQIRPKEEEIKEKKQQLAEMEEELEGLQKINVSLELQTQELKEKLTATNNELDKERNENKKNNSTLNRMRLDIHNAYGIINELKKLKSAIKDLYHKYSMDPAYVSTRKVDEDIQDEFMRQREFLEHTIKVLRKQVSLQTLGRTSEGKIMEEHAELIEEVNHLRRELKYAQHHIRDMESVLGPGARYINPKQAQDKLEAAIKTREAIKQEYDDRMEARKHQKLEAVNEQLKQEVDGLRAQIKEEQMKRVHEEKPKGKEKKVLHHLSY
ncbi:Cilia-and flagella-associated protein 57, partial [Gryllus bimaculatus]